MINRELLKEVVEWVEAQDKLPLEKRAWMQEYYVAGPRTIAYNLAMRRGDTSNSTVDALEPKCGTAYCVAGYIGQKFDDRYISDEGGTFGPDFEVEIPHVSVFAAEKLGLEWQDAENGLFDGANTAEDIRRIAEDLAGGPL